MTEWTPEEERVANWFSDHWWDGCEVKSGGGRIAACTGPCACREAARDVLAISAILSVSEAAMTDVSEIAERLRAVLNDGLSSVAICNKNDLRAILDDRERLEKAAIAEQKYSHSLERSISDSKARISQLGANACRGSTTTSPTQEPQS